jgi:uncharacterized membrane protein (DUF485 family)
MRTQVTGDRHHALPHHPIRDFFHHLNNKKDRFWVTALAITMSVVPTSLAVAVAAFTVNNFALAASLLLCAIALGCCLAVARLSLLLVMAFISMVFSVSVIVYGLARHWDQVAPYIGISG